MSMSVTRGTTLQAASAAALVGAASGVIGAGSAGAEERTADGNVVFTYPIPDGVPTNAAFTVKVRPVGGTWETVGVFLANNGRVIRDSGGKPSWYPAGDGIPMFVNDHVQGLRFLTTEETAAQ